MAIAWPHKRHTPPRGKQTSETHSCTASCREDKAKQKARHSRIVDEKISLFLTAYPKATQEDNFHTHNVRSLSDANALASLLMLKG